MTPNPSLASLIEATERPGALERARKSCAHVRYATPFHWHRFVSELKSCGYDETGPRYQGEANSLRRIVGVYLRVGPIFADWLADQSREWTSLHNRRVEARYIKSPRSSRRLPGEEGGPIIPLTQWSRPSIDWIHRAIQGRTPGEVAQIAARNAASRRHGELMAKHGDALASLQQVLRHR